MNAGFDVQLRLFENVIKQYYANLEKDKKAKEVKHNFEMLQSLIDVRVSDEFDYMKFECKIGEADEDFDLVKLTEIAKLRYIDGKYEAEKNGHKRKIISWQEAK